MSQFSGKIILILDEFDKVEMKMQENLFKSGFLLFLRGFLQHTPHVSAIVSGNFDFNKLPVRWQEFFSIFSSKRIGALDEDSATRLITEPVKDSLLYDHYAIQKILEYSGGNPYFIQLICHTLILHINDIKKEYLVEAEDVNFVIFEIATQKAEATLRLTWNELSDNEKNILFALSCMRIKLGRYVELRELEENLKQNKIAIKRWELISHLGSLREKDIILKLGDHPPFFDLKIFILGEWVKEHGKFYR
jgi:type I restriction enzyme M protein